MNGKSYSKPNTKIHTMFKALTGPDQIAIFVIFAIGATALGFAIQAYCWSHSSRTDIDSLEASANTTLHDPTVFVSTQGSDGADGTSAENPMRSVPEAVKRLQKLRTQAGTWTGTCFLRFIGPTFQPVAAVWELPFDVTLASAEPLTMLGTCKNTNEGQYSAGDSVTMDAAPPADAVFFELQGVEFAVEPFQPFTGTESPNDIRISGELSTGTPIPVNSVFAFYKPSTRVLMLENADVEIQGVCTIEDLALETFDGSRMDVKGAGTVLLGHGTHVDMTHADDSLFLFVATAEMRLASITTLDPALGTYFSADGLVFNATVSVIDGCQFSGGTGQVTMSSVLLGSANTDTVAYFHGTSGSFQSCETILKRPGVSSVLTVTAGSNLSWTSSSISVGNGSAVLTVTSGSVMRLNGFSLQATADPTVPVVKVENGSQLFMSNGSFSAGNLINTSFGGIDGASRVSIGNVNDNTGLMASVDIEGATEAISFGGGPAAARNAANTSSMTLA